MLTTMMNHEVHRVLTTLRIATRVMIETLVECELWDEIVDEPHHAMVGQILLHHDSI
jgi:hypothetical protein